MNDDYIYVFLLFFSISFGYFYRKIDDIPLKKNIGTCIGLVITLLVSGLHILHPLITTLVNALIILFVDKRKCHIVSFVFSFLYLLFFRTTTYFGIPYAPGHTNMIQMILTLKLVGLAFEINSAYLAKKKNEDSEVILEGETNPSFMDIFHYAFNYVGVLTGPYYQYKVFMDYMKLPYYKYADWKNATLHKLKYVPLFAVLYLWASYNWPISYALTDEFHKESSWLYRYWYIWPNFFIFRMRIYIGLTLSECVCTMAGFGAYPSMTVPKPGHGPTENIAVAKSSLNDETELSKTEYNFETIKNINPYGADFCTTYREAMKHWNICIQYWLAVNIYQRFPYKKFRMQVTTLISALWHGVYLGYYVCIATVPLVLAVENIWVKLVLKGNQRSKLKLAEWCVWFFRMHFFSYQAIAFILLDVDKIVHYYNSIYHAGLILGIILYISGLFLLKNRKQKRHEGDN